MTVGLSQMTLGSLLKCAAFTTLIAITCSPVASYAGTPEADYLAARKTQYGIIQKAVAANKSSDEIGKLDEAGRNVLKQKLLAVFAPTIFPTNMGKPWFSPETLQDGYIGSHSVDGVLFVKGEGAQRYLYTTDNIVTAWASGMKENSDIADGIKKGIPSFVKTDSFINEALSEDAATVPYLDLDVVPPAGTNVRAFSGLFAQDVPSTPPNTIFFVVSKGETIVVASVKAKTAVGDPKQCAKAKQNDDDEAAYSGCVAGVLKKSPQLATLTAEAQKLVDAVANRLP